MFNKKPRFHYRRPPKIYLSTPKQRESFKFPWRGIKTLFIIAVLAGLSYFFFFSPLFVIANVRLEGASNQEVIRLCQEAKGKNLWLFSKKRLQQKIEEFAEVSEVKIGRRPAKTLKIEVVEKKEGIVWQTGDKQYLLDITGAVIKEVKENDLPKVLDEKGAPVTTGKQLVTSAFVSFVRELHFQFGQKTALKLVEISISESIFEVSAKTDTIYLKLDPQGDLEAQLDYFVKAYQEKKDEIKEYVDLTTWDKGIVVYK